MCLPLSAWSEASKASILGLITDIDDTLTDGGQLAVQARDALVALKDANIPVLAVTGRPVGWSLRWLTDNPARGEKAWPLMGIVAENGAVALRQESGGQISRIYRDDADTRKVHYRQLQDALQMVEAAMPQARRADDSAGRETDIAIDHSEHHRLDPEEIQKVAELLQSQGLRVSVSSIHINAWLGHHDKWVGACWALQAWLGRSLPLELSHWVYVGDSSNDEAMFRHLPFSVGVANISPFLSRMQHRPRYITQFERGLGFAEVAKALLDARQV